MARRNAAGDAAAPRPKSEAFRPARCDTGLGHAGEPLPGLLGGTAVDRVF